jgi:predicted enzyme related to lactoylglutathione lyase
MPMSLRFEIFVADLDATVAFYSSALGFSLMRDERTSDLPYVGMERDDVRLGAVGGHRPADPAERRPPTGVELVLEVDDLELERHRVTEAGCPLHEDLQRRPWGLTDFRVLDPSGYLLRITSRE